MEIQKTRATAARTTMIKSGKFTLITEIFLSFTHIARLRLRNAFSKLMEKNAGFRRFADVFFFYRTRNPRHHSLLRDCTHQGKHKLQDNYADDWPRNST